MEGAEQILVVILSGTLAVFLILAVIIAIKTIQILNYLKSISEKAEHLVTTAESVGELFKSTAGPIAVGRLLSNISEMVFSKRSKSKGKDE